ncbi:unnamed protein product [Sphagnum tenellum]
MDPGKKMKDEADKLRILSIDGGGVRGVIPAIFSNLLKKNYRSTRRCLSSFVCHKLRFVFEEADRDLV